MSMSAESSAEIERDAETERAELISTLGQLRENLKPANVIDEVMAGAQVNVSDITDRIWRTARANPIPSVLIGLGAAMLLGVGQKLKSHTGATGSLPASPTVPRSTAGAPTASTLHTAGDRANAAKDRLSSRLDTIGAKASRAASQIADSADELKRQASRTLNRTTHSAREGYSSFSKDGIMTQYSRSRDQITHSIGKLLDDQPLVLAALGIAVGAAIGAAIPSSETEAQLMGDASGSVKHAARELALEQYSHLKETAAQTIDEVKRTAADRGLSTENLAGLVQDVGGNVQNAAYEVGAHVADTIPHKD